MPQLNLTIPELRLMRAIMKEMNDFHYDRFLNIIREIAPREGTFVTSKINDTLLDHGIELE